MAASKRSSAQPVKRSDTPSVPRSGGRANARTSVAGGNAGARTAAKAGKASRKVLPPVQSHLPEVGDTPTARVPTAYPSDRYPHVDPKVLLSAFARAEKSGAPENVKWDATRQQWVVPSATDPRRSYRVWRRRGRRGPLPFYVALECNCVAEQSGSYLCCWHKCAVKLWLNEWFSKMSFGDQLEEVGADDPNDD